MCDAYEEACSNEKYFKFVKHKFATTSLRRKNNPCSWTTDSPVKKKFQVQQ